MALTLYEKALLCEAMLYARHYDEGQVRQHVILPPVGKRDHSTGNHESDALATGMHLEALSFKWAVTKDSAAKAQAKAVARGIRKLQRITGVRGCFARGFKRANGPTWDEGAFFFPKEWHQAGEYRWVGDPSTDSLVGIMSGYETYFDLVADAKEKAEVAKDVDIIMSRIVEKGMRIVDIDGRLTLWGIMSVYALEEDLNALQALSHLRGAYHITRKRRYLDEYYRLIREWDYLRRAVRANAQDDPPPAHYDWNLAICPLHAVMRYEKDPNLLRHFYRALERQLRGAYANGPQDAFVNWVYKRFRAKAGIRPEAREWMVQTQVGTDEFPKSGRAVAPPPMAQQRTLEATISGKRQKLEVEYEGFPRAYLRAYWAGRYFGFVAAEA